MIPTLPNFAAITQRLTQSLPFKRAQQGLFHGKQKLSGNNVPFSLKKTRRTWLPNVQHKRIPSEALGGVRVKVTTRALRCIEKHGGLDNYLLNTKCELLGIEGMRLRLLVRERAAEQRRVAHEAKAKEVNEEEKDLRAAQAVVREEKRQQQKLAKRRERESELAVSEGILGSSSNAPSKKANVAVEEVPEVQVEVQEDIVSEAKAQTQTQTQEPDVDTAALKEEEENARAERRKQKKQSASRGLFD
ncbi:hypothetical protein CONPUDRAFT_106160 [Coniophora puteana RWD-64-598 SS2]|uniref:Large ribosomal subunit protein bL28m n=1 Tax=Coniophora puteana (strain RWD-64-598) TaxID=741705 RepID=A0A5M3MLM4_CONPW|nr:uncharacterized protein CONPUDRAFT_106160 [Coniophora puteana RWD-64-598 SS2]EIW79575.1 hypothetical protein CONPUDRAFT_106160 [Coniophora puteana RWD-64-598 SS2]